MNRPRSEFDFYPRLHAIDHLRRAGEHIRTRCDHAKASMEAQALLLNLRLAILNEIEHDYAGVLNGKVSQ